MTQKRFQTKSVGQIRSKPSRGGKKWVLAVDPFKPIHIQPLKDMVEALAEKTNSQVIASFVLAPASVNWTGEFSGPWMKKYKPMATQKLESLFKDHHFKTTVIACAKSGLRAAVQTLTQFAKKVNAEFIVLTTHSAEGVLPWSLGNFAETLILATKTPVLIVNPEHHVPKVVRRLLVTTDLSRKSGQYVLKVGDFARSIGAEVILYHKQVDPLDPVIQQGVYSLGGGWVSVQNFIDDERETKSRQLEKMETLLSRRGVSVSQVLETGPQNIVESINEAAEIHTVDMICVFTEASPLSAAILGSVARGLVRTAKVPIMVRR